MHKSPQPITRRLRGDTLLSQAALPSSLSVLIIVSTLLSAGSALAQPSWDSESIKILSALEDATVQAIASAEQSVVAIARVRRDQTPANRAQFDPLQLRNPLLFQGPLENPDFVPKFFGSGVIISPDGFIVTCAHVLDDPRTHDYFVWRDKRSYQARVIGLAAKVYAADPFSDLAVLKIDQTDLNPIRFGNAEDLRKGKFVLALGNPDATAMDGQASASWGIVSNLMRVAPTESDTVGALNKETLHQYGTLLQTDAKVGLGSSGGALINLQGEMVGLVTSQVARAGFESSAGFAIAVDDLFRRVVESLKLGKLPEYGFLGIQPEDISPRDRQRGFRGARVGLVLPGLPGDQAGLKTGDVILQVNQRPIGNRNDLFRELSRVAAAADVELLVQRSRPGDVHTSVLRLKSRLSKKFVATARPAFAINGPPNWRGLAVDYTSAVLSERTRSGILSGERDPPKVAVLSVEPDTPAWNAGLRPGFGILAVGSTAVETPDQFRRLVEQQPNAVELAIVGNDGQSGTVNIPSQNPVD